MPQPPSFDTRRTFTNATCGYSGENWHTHERDPDRDTADERKLHSAKLMHHEDDAGSIPVAGDF
jgi:hypothetical protein